MLTTQWRFTNMQKSNEKSIPYHQTVQIHFTLIQICKICWQSNSVPVEEWTVTGSGNFLLNITDYIQFLEQHYQTRPFIFTKRSHLIGGGKCKMGDEAPLISPRPVQSFFSQYKWRKNIKMFLTIPLILDDSFLEKDVTSDTWTHTTVLATSLCTHLLIMGNIR